MLNIVFSVVQFMSKILAASKILPIPSLTRLLQTRSSEEAQFSMHFIGSWGLGKPSVLEAREIDRIDVAIYFYRLIDKSISISILAMNYR